MSNTINNGIPFVPENTIDPAAGLNISLNTVDALLQVLVVSIGLNTPPGSPANGSRYIVGTAPTGAWAGQANKLARWLDGAWQFFDARYALNQADGQWYARSGATWAQLGGALADGSVTNPKLANMATQTIKGRASAGSGVPEDLTPSQVRTLLSLVVGTDVQAFAQNLSALSGLTGAADKGIHFTGAGAMAVHDQTPFARTLLDDANAGTARATLGLGSAATRTALGSTGSLYSRDSILGTVSQSGGVPTGSIIERGSNANGDYVRYADGTQICTIKTLLGGASSSASSFDIVWTFPATFVNADYVASAIHNTQGGIPSPERGGCFESTSHAVGSCVIRYVTPGSVSQTISSLDIQCAAIGRWY